MGQVFPGFLSQILREGFKEFGKESADGDIADEDIARTDIAETVSAGEN